jgi:hypothetical protein
LAAWHDIVSTMAIDTEPSAAYLEIRSGSAAGQRRSLEGRTLIGRSPASTLPLDHASVSRQHAEITLDSRGRWMIRDLQSRNGTTVNSALITEKTLRDGDQIAIGEVSLYFSHEGAALTIADQEETPGFTISALDRLAIPRVSAEHVGAIVGFGRSLQDVADASERLRRLLDLAVTAELGGWWSYALNISDIETELQVRSICPPVNNPTGALQEPHVSKSVLRAVLAGHEPVVANNLSQLTRFHAELTISPESGRFSAVACPLDRTEAGADVLYVILPPRLGSVEWLMLFSLAVEQFRHANSIWAARADAQVRAALDREMVLARAVQARTLPRNSPGGAIDWAVRFEPCLSVAGDYVDVITRQDGKVLMLIADAAGKGMQAALIVAGLHAIFHTQGREESSLSDVSSAADCYLRTYLADFSFVTFTALLLDPLTGEGVCVNCGHPPMLAVGRGGQVRPLAGGENLPLGLCQGPVKSSAVQIEPDEWVIAYTDGLSEMQNPAGKMLGYATLAGQLGTICASTGSCDAARLAARIADWLDEYRGSAAPIDDRTLLVARRPSYPHCPE